MEDRRKADFRPLKIKLLWKNGKAILPTFKN